MLVLNFVKAHGPSMLPTLNLTGDVLLVEKLSPLLGKVGTGDVVLVRSPVNPRKTIVKRIVGMEGDRITFLVDPGRSDRSQSLVVRIRLRLTIKEWRVSNCYCVFFFFFANFMLQKYNSLPLIVVGHCSMF